MNNLTHKLIWSFISLFFLALFVYVNFFKGRDETPKSLRDERNILVFIPGRIAGSPLYQALTLGVQDITNSYRNIQVDIFEADFNQGEWEPLLDKKLSIEHYDFVISSNNSMQNIVDNISFKYPNTKFLIFDSFVKNTNKQVYSLSYNVAEEAYILGYYAALFLKERGESSKKVGIISGQEYPIMMQYIKPYFEAGFNEILSSPLVFRTLGNWYDSNKAKVLARDLIKKHNVKVILSITGSAIEGVLKAVAEEEAFALVFDGEDYLEARDNIIASGKTEQRKFVSFVLKNALENKIEFGTYDLVGMKEGGVSFDDNNEYYKREVSDHLKETLNHKREDLKRNPIELNF